MPKIGQPHGETQSPRPHQHDHGELVPFIEAKFPNRACLLLSMSNGKQNQGQRIKAFLLVLKDSGGGVLKPAKVYKLKHLSKVEVIQNDPSGCTFMLGFDNLRSQSVAPPQWTMRNKDDRNRILLCILNLSKEILGRLPKVVGIDIVEMALWAKQHTPAVGNQVITHDGLDASIMIQNDTRVIVERDLVSQAEEEDMEALLGTYVMRIGEAEAFSESLKRELFGSRSS